MVYVLIIEGSVQMSVNIIQSSGCFSGVVMVVYSAGLSAQNPVCDFVFTSP